MILFDVCFFKESLKTEEDRKAEEQLLEQLVNYVARRNKIVEKMEEDRLRCVQTLNNNSAGNSASMNLYRITLEI